MSTRHQQEVVMTCSPANEMQPPIQDPVDGWTASELVSDAENWHYTAQMHPLVSKMERAPQDQILYEDLASMMKEQAERIQELEHNLE